MKKSIIIIGIIVILFIGIQFIKVDQQVTVDDPTYNFLYIEQISQEAEIILKESCFDCHSNNTIYPWYSKIAPVSWLTASHIKEGREHLDFSDWGHYSKTDRSKILEECVEEIEKGSMPLKSYVLMHKDARLTDEEVKIIRQQFLKATAGGIAALN